VSSEDFYNVLKEHWNFTV